MLSRPACIGDERLMPKLGLSQSCGTRRPSLTVGGHKIGTHSAKSAVVNGYWLTTV